MQYTHLDLKNSEPCKHYRLLKNKSSPCVTQISSSFPSPLFLLIGPPRAGAAFGNLALFPLEPLVLPLPFRAQGQSAWPLLPDREHSLAPPEHSTRVPSLHVCVLSRPVKSSICGNLISSLQWSINLLDYSQAYRIIFS